MTRNEQFRGELISDLTSMIRMLTSLINIDSHRVEESIGKVTYPTSTILIKIHVVSIIF